MADDVFLITKFAVVTLIAYKTSTFDEFLTMVVVTEKTAVGKDLGNVTVLFPPASEDLNPY